MILKPNLLERLSQKAGENVSTPYGANILTLDIETVTGVKIGLNTVKRLTGVLDDEVEKPRRSTLNAIANYLGYPDWEMLDKDSYGKGSRFIRESPFMDLTRIDYGVRVEICWPPDRRLVIRHDGVGQYTVLESENCKLEAGDLLSMSQVGIGYPFIAHKVFRNEHPLGCYQASPDAGVKIINRLVRED